MGKDTKTIRINTDEIEQLKKIYPQAKANFSEFVRKAIFSEYPINYTSSYNIRKLYELKKELTEKKKKYSELEMQITDLNELVNYYTEKVNKELKEKQEVEEQMWNNSI